MTTTNAAADSHMRQIRGVTPYLSVSDSRAAADFYAKALGAEIVSLMTMGESTKVIHGYIIVNGGPVFLSDPFPEHGYPLEKPQSFSLHLQVDDADRWWKRAVDAGCEPVMPVTLQFWGDRYGQVRDPFGVTWTFGSAVAKS